MKQMCSQHILSRRCLQTDGYSVPLKIAFIISIMRTHLPNEAAQVFVIQNNVQPRVLQFKIVRLCVFFKFSLF